MIVSGNLVNDTGRDGVLTNGIPEKPPPHYRWAVYVSKATNGPVRLKFSNNLFHPRTEGIPNVPPE